MKRYWMGSNTHWRNGDADSISCVFINPRIRAMQFILFLLGIFAIGCVLYGISAGVQIIQRGFSRLANTAHAPEANASKPRLPTSPPPSEQPAPSSAQRCLDELNELHRLYQNGALTREEFEQFKRHLLSPITPPTTRSNQENP